MADKIYGLNERDKRLLQQMLREFNRQPRDFAAPRGGQKVRSTADRFLFRNDSGETIPPGGIMRQTGTEMHADDYLVRVMDKPATTEWKMPWYVNLGEEVEDGGYATCATFRAEAGQAYYLSGTIVVGDSWGPKGGQWNLERYYPGFRIVGNEADGLVYVEQREPRILAAKADGGGVSARSSTTLGSDSGTVIQYRNGTTISATTFTVTTYNEAATAVEADAYLQIVDIDGAWFVNWEECA